MTETSTTYRWRPRVKVMWLFLPRIPHVVWAALTVFSLAQQVFWFDLRARRAPPTARAVSAMVREDAREAIATLQRESMWWSEWSDGVNHDAPIDIYQQPEWFIINNSDIADDSVDTSPFTITANGSGAVLLRLDADGNLLLRGKVKEGVR